ncbi:MAG: LamG domain-containing protein [Candidatus Cloacimonetes bacterium]|nr:LamG domain-containing protein [Candidatus Cloacimonadota bacterium]
MFRMLLIFLLVFLLSCTRNETEPTGIDRENSVETELQPRYTGVNRILYSKTKISAGELYSRFLSTITTMVTIPQNILERAVTGFHPDYPGYLTVRNASLGKVLTLPENPLALYTFSGNASDQSVYNNDGTVHGAVLTSDRYGNPDCAYYFDGEDDYIDIGNDASLKPYFPMTISGWVNISESTCQVFFTNNYDDDIYNGIWIGISPDGYAEVSYGDGGDISANSRRTKTGTTYIEPGIWYHIVGVLHDEWHMKLYLNGQIDTGIYTGFTFILNYSDGPGNIGRKDGSSYSPPLYFHGIIDDIVFYNRALTEEEILILYYLDYNAKLIEDRQLVLNQKSN